MTYFLDTSVIIDLLKNKDNIVNFINNHLREQIITSAICEAEVYVGVYRLKGSDRIRLLDKIGKTFLSFHDVVKFDSEQARIFGELKADLQIGGNIIEDTDILIASAAISRSAVLLTGNTRHFNRVKNLRVTEP